jgi:hypothetical protein
VSASTTVAGSKSLAELCTDLTTGEQAAYALHLIADKLTELGDAPLPRFGLTVGMHLFGSNPSPQPRMPNAQLRAGVDAIAAALGMTATRSKTAPHQYSAPDVYGTCGVSVVTVLHTDGHDEARHNEADGRHQIACTCEQWATGWHETYGAAQAEHDRHAGRTPTVDEPASGGVIPAPISRDRLDEIVGDLNARHRDPDAFGGDDVHEYIGRLPELDYDATLNAPERTCVLTDGTRVVFYGDTKRWGWYTPMSAEVA